MCQNVCLLFYGKYAELKSCKFCGHQRYDERGKAFRIATYISIASILRTMFESPEFAKEVRAHEEAYQEMKTRCAQEDISLDDWVMDDIWYSPGWFHLFREEWTSEKDELDPRHIAICLSTDGIAAFETSSVSLWPITATILNLPPLLRNSFRYLIVTGMVPGERGSSVEDINSFLQPVVDELSELYVDGFECYDAHTQEVFRCHVKLVYFVTDNEAAMKVSYDDVHHSSRCRHTFPPHND